MRKSRRPATRLAAALATALIGCASLVGLAAQEPIMRPSDALFKDDTIQRVDLRMHSADWEKLKQNFQTNEYYPADVVFKGHTTRNAGVRSRGLGSRSGTKPGLRVDFDRYSTDQTFLGVKSFVLDNLTQDASMVKETVAMKLFGRLNIPAPRESHTVLYVNNEQVGVYAIVESIDKQLLARVFGEVDGNTQDDGFLFEFNYVDPWYFNYFGTDWDLYRLRFDPKTRESQSDQDTFGPLEALIRLANDLPADQLMPRLGDYLDLPAFIRYVAAQNFVAQEDGFLGYAGMNNFYLYRLEDTNRHVFLSWDEDNAFKSTDFPLTARHDENVLMRKAMQVPELRDEYYRMLSQAASSASEPTGDDGRPWLEVEMRRQLDLVANPIRNDRYKPYTVTDHETARGMMLEFAQNRSRTVTDQLGGGATRRPN